MYLSAFDVALADRPGLCAGLVSHVRIGNLPIVQHKNHGGRPVVKTGSPIKINTKWGPAFSVDGSSALEVAGYPVATSSSGPLSFSLYLSLDVTGSSSKYAFGQSNSGGTIYTLVSGFTGNGTGGSTNGRQYISFGYYNSGNGRIKHCYFPGYVNKAPFMFTGVMDSATSFRCYLNGVVHDPLSYDIVYGSGNSIPSNRTDRWGFGQMGEFAAARSSGIIGEALVHSRALSADDAYYIHQQVGRRRYENPRAFVPSAATSKPWLYRRASSIARPYLQVA